MTNFNLQKKITKTDKVTKYTPQSTCSCLAGLTQCLQWNSNNGQLLQCTINLVNVYISKIITLVIVLRMYH